jgi:tetratricopeptide (TPR) repeat protein
VEKRLALGRLEDALADAEHLEAIARGTVAKHAVWLRAGRMWQIAGVGDHAAALFERALRFAPDQPAALAGLGSALVENGREARGASLLARALSLAEACGEPTSSIALALARALAERLDDLPTAVAHAAAIAPDAVEGPIARGLEGRWRAALGDATGAGLAFARLRELSAAIAASEDERRRRPIAELLVEASKVEKKHRRDPLAARRYLGEALRLLPHDRELRRLYREACGIDADAPDGETPSEARRVVSFDVDTPSESEASDLDIERSARVDELTRRLHADPKDDATADALADLLEALGRGHELLALLSAGLADASIERRIVLAPRARAALERLAVQAESAGRAGEASLYRDAATALTS